MHYGRRLVSGDSSNRGRKSRECSKFETQALCRRSLPFSYTNEYDIMTHARAGDGVERASQAEIASYAAMQFRQKPGASPSPPVEVTDGPANQRIPTCRRAAGMPESCRGQMHFQLILILTTVTVVLVKYFGWCWISQELEGHLRSRPRGLYVCTRVIIWKCILNKRLVQICIEDHCQILYIVRTRKVGHFIYSADWVFTCYDCLPAGAQSDTMVSGLVPLQST